MYNDKNKSQKMLDIGVYSNPYLYKKDL